MTLKGEQAPTIQEEVLYRTKTQLALFDTEVVNDTVARISQGVACAPFRKFGLYVNIDSTSSPDLLHIEVEFLDRWSERWYSYKQGLFAALFYEDTDTASGIWEAFVGDVLGRALRVKLTGENVAASGNVLGAAKYFTVSIAVDLWN